MGDIILPFFTFFLLTASFPSYSDSRKCIGKSTSSLDLFLLCAGNPLDDGCWSPVVCEQPTDGCFSYVNRGSMFENINFTAGCMRYDQCIEAKSFAPSCTLASVLSQITLPLPFECVSCCNDGCMCNNLLGIQSTVVGLECTNGISQQENETTMNQGTENAIVTSHSNIDVSVTEFPVTNLSYTTMASLENNTVANTNVFVDMARGISNMTTEPKTGNLMISMEDILSSTSSSTTANNPDALETTIVKITTGSSERGRNLSSDSAQQENSSVATLNTSVEGTVLLTTENNSITSDQKTISVSKVRGTTGSRSSTIQTYVKERTSTGAGLTHKEDDSVTESINTIESTVTASVVSSDILNHFLTTANQTLWHNSTYGQPYDSPHLFSRKKVARLCAIVGQGVSFALERSVDHDSPTFKCFGRN